VSVTRSSGRPFILAVPTDEAMQAMSHKIVARPMTRLIRRGALVEEQGSTCMSDNDVDPDYGRARRSRQALPPDTTHNEFDLS
jgi:hypothetical protein